MGYPELKTKCNSQMSCTNMSIQGKIQNKYNRCHPQTSSSIWPTCTRPRPPCSLGQSINLLPLSAFKHNRVS